jgi:DeoR family transcriptional regulator of aga operon
MESMSVHNSSMQPLPQVKPGLLMLVEERRQHILVLMQRDGRVLVDELSASLGISSVTIRKDLADLQNRGDLRRTHGGALLPGARAPMGSLLQQEKEKYSAEIERIATAASDLVEEGQCVLLDSGRVTSVMARKLKRHSRLTVITNALNIAGELCGTNFEVLVTGGSLRENSSSLVGPVAEDMLRDLHVDTLFLGVDGFDLEFGLTTADLLVSRVRRAMVKAASNVVTVCDSTKFGLRSFSKIADASEVHHVITDSNLDLEVADKLRNRNIRVTLV